MSAQARTIRTRETVRVAAISMLASLVAAAGCFMAWPGRAAAELAPGQLSGRWSTTDGSRQRCGQAACRLTYDLVPCAEGWCGIEVNADRSCGRTAFRLDSGKAEPFGVEFRGSYQRMEAAQVYAVSARLHNRRRTDAAQAQLFLAVFGNNDGHFQMFRRSYPLHMVLAREGEAACRAQPGVSGLRPPPHSAIG